MVDIYIGPDNTHWVLHEKLLCAKSKFFSQVFFTKYNSGYSGSKTFGLPEEEEESFRVLVGWLYSGRVPQPEEEKELSDLLDLYLMGEKWQIADLVKDVLSTVRKFYRRTDTFPDLRRVQYVYANTDEDSPMRQLMVNSVARMLILGEAMPTHWEKALRKNGQMAFDIIRAVQVWKLEPKTIPDARQEAQPMEKERVQAVEQAEELQEGVLNGDERSELDAAAAPRDLESLVSGINGVSNGVSGEY
jgi:hypothetical protein